MYGIRLTGSLFQAHTFLSFRLMPDDLKTVVELLSELPFLGIGGLPSGSKLWEKTNFTYKIGEWPVEKNQIGKQNLKTKRHLDVQDPRLFGLLIYIARHLEMLRNGRCDSLLYLLMQYVPHSASHWRKMLERWQSIKGKKKTRAKRITYYSRLLEDISVMIFLFVHQNVNVLYDMDRGIPQVALNTEELLKQNLDFTLCYNGRMQQCYGNGLGDKYVLYIAI